MTPLCGLGRKTSTQTHLSHCLDAQSDLGWPGRWGRGVRVCVCVGMGGGGGDWGHALRYACLSCGLP